jgi:N-acetylglucosaminyldiphosphoundecaprenol N-acetyl-beta-D-mannosaminyltransferase
MIVMEKDTTYQVKRDFIVCGVVGVCATTKNEFVNKVFSITTDAMSGTVDLIGVPAIISAKEDPKIAQMYNASTLAAIDGMPLVRKGRKLGFNSERCAAPDIMGSVFEESVKQGKTHYFYGGKDNEVLENLKTILIMAFPGIQIVGMYSPPFRPLTDEEDDQICKEINDLHPDFLWVGIGAPKQEMWMWNHQEKIKGTVMLGVGAGFNFFAGSLDKAPTWMENASLEWLFRLFKEPKRLWRRYVLGGCKWIFYNLTCKTAKVKI